MDKKNKNVIFQDIIASKSKVDIFVLLEGDDDNKVLWTNNR